VPRELRPVPPEKKEMVFIAFIKPPHKQIVHVRVNKEIERESGSFLTNDFGSSSKAMKKLIRCFHPKTFCPIIQIFGYMHRALNIDLKNN
jgi:hypothetical protein